MEADRCVRFPVDGCHESSTLCVHKTDDIRSNNHLQIQIYDIYITGVFHTAVELSLRVFILLQMIFKSSPSQISPSLLNHIDQEVENVCTLDCLFDVLLLQRTALVVLGEGPAS